MRIINHLHQLFSSLNFVCIPVDEPIQPLMLTEYLFIKYKAISKMKYWLDMRKVKNKVITAKTLCLRMSIENHDISVVYSVQSAWLPDIPKRSHRLPDAIARAVYVNINRDTHELLYALKQDVYAEIK